MSIRFLLAHVALVAAATAEQSVTPNYAELWSQFKKKYSKEYDANGKESESHRFEIFKSNVDMIREHNAKNLSYWLGVNQFTDLTDDEFSATHLSGYRSDWKQFREVPTEPFPSYDSETLDDNVDWVSRGAVTPVKDQQFCGSCWAFSTTGSVEGAFFVASGHLLSLSEEELVQCDKKKDEGCGGGLPDFAFNYVKRNGISAEAKYPYTSGGGETGQCATEKRHPVVKISGFVDVPHNENALKAAVATQPVSIGIEADKHVFKSYTGGVFDHPSCGKNLDHAVLIVGYGTAGKDYWKVKNSWGVSWGEEGYIRMVRGKDMCGITKAASYPTGASAVRTAPGPSPPPGPPPPGPPPPGPSPPGSPHYEDPAGGCLSDEKAVRVQGVSGSFCSPRCKSMDCPQDVPEHVSAKPTCMLRDSSGKRWCALMCSRGMCGAATCHKIQGTGICTYKSHMFGNTSMVDMAPTEESIVV